MFSILLLFILSFSLCAEAFNKSSKRGIAFAASDTPGDLELLNADQTNMQAIWVYDWTNSPADYLSKSRLEFIPMQWGSNGVDQFQSVVRRQGAKTVLAFNEPDLESQSNIHPEVAAQLWMKYIEPLKTSAIRLGAPAATGSPEGRRWLDAFLKACKRCTIDFLPLHWYGDGLAAFYDYLWSLHGQYPQYPIWITEFASTSSNKLEVISFMNSSVFYLDSLSWVERYAWFGYFRPKAGQLYSLLDLHGSLNDLGQLYTGVHN